MKRATLVRSLTTCVLFGLTALPIAAVAQATTTETQPSSGAESVSAPNLADECLGNLRTFLNQIQTEGYWLGGAGSGDIGLDENGDGYGYPVGGYGYGIGLGGYSTQADSGYLNARPGYEIRTLLAAANILARHGQQQPCEDVLATTREIYSLYVADMIGADMPMTNVPGWQEQQIASAVPVTKETSPVRSDQLLGTEVRNPQYEALGNVDDLVMNSQTGKIAYLLISRGGIFGLGEKHIPVPWEAFSVTPNATLLVLDASKSVIEAAPQVDTNDLSSLGQQSQDVDAYWTTLTSR